MRSRPDSEDVERCDGPDAEASEDVRIDRALREAMREALLQHQRAGNPVPVYRDGRIVEVPATEIELPAE